MNKISRSLLTCLLICLVALSALATPAMAQNVNDTAKVNSGDGELNMRAGPSTGDRILHVLKNGENVKVLQKSGNWARVRHATKGEGWVYTPLLSVPDNPADVRFKAADKALVCNDKVDLTNVRSGPGAKDHGVLAQLNNGARVGVERVVTNKDGYIYYEISFIPAGETRKRLGYIYHNALRASCNGVSVTNKPVEPKTAKQNLPDSSLSLEGDSCMIIVASRKSVGEVLGYFAHMDGWSESFRSGRRAVLMRNGWFAISIGTTDSIDFKVRQRANLIRNVRGMPNDITCSRLTQAVRIMNSENLEKERKNNSKAKNVISGKALPPLKEIHRYELREESEEKVREAFKEFASLWTSNSAKDLKDGVEIKTTAVSNAHSNPRGVQWCQFKIDVETIVSYDGYAGRTTNSSYFGNAMELGDPIMGLNDESTERARNLVSYFDNALDLRILTYKDNGTHEGYTLAQCSDYKHVGFREFIGSEACDNPRFSSLNKDMINKRFHALTKYYRQCSSQVTLERVMAEVRKIEAEDTDALIAQNPQSEEALRAALEKRKGDTLLIKDAGLRDISALSTFTTVKNLYLQQNDIADISALSGLGQMKFLNLSGNKIERIDALADLTGLVSLNLSNNAINDVSALARLTNLSGLNLKGNPITELGPIQHLIDDPKITVLLD